MERESQNGVNNEIDDPKAPLLDGWKLRGSGRLSRRLSRRNSVNSLRNEFISRLPDKVRSGVDPESSSLFDLSRTMGLTKGSYLTLFLSN